MQLCRLIGVLACGSLAACGRLGFDSEASDAHVEQCAADEIVCGNFEGDLGGWIPRGVTGGLTTVDVVSAPVALGQGALMVRADVDGNGVIGAERTFPPIADGTLYARVMLWVGSRTSINDYLVAIQLDDGNDDGEEKLSVDILPYQGFVLTSTTANPAVRPGSAANVVRHDGWMCLSLQVDVDELNGAVRLYDRDTLLVSVDSIDTVPFPDGFHRFLLAAVQPLPGVGELGFDGVALARQPIPCP